MVRSEDMEDNKIQNINEINETNKKPLKTWDEAIKELAGFIQKTKAEEAKAAKEVKEQE